MNKAPRASLCITILDDEDYRVLMASKGGMEAFGLFAAMIIVGRERLQQGQARQLSETESLKFDNSTTHILAMAHASWKQLDRCLKALEEVASETGSEPWMYLDETRHLVIRSFFKFNTSASWGGYRPGSGRGVQKNQDAPKTNHLDSAKESSRFLSGSYTGSYTGSVTDPPFENGGGGGGGKEPAGNSPDQVKSVEALAAQLFPCSGWEANARRACDDTPSHWVAEALQIGRDGNAASWNFVRSVIDRFRRQNGTDSEVKARRAPPARASPAKPKLTPEEKAALIESEMKARGMKP